MPDVLPLVEADSIALELLEIDDNSPARATPHRLVVGAGASTTAFDSVGFTAAVTHAYLGNLVEFTSGENAGLVREIVAYNGGGQVTVHPALDYIPSAADAFLMWRRPAAVARAEGGAAGTVNADSDAGAGGEYARDEAAEFWSDGGAPGTLLGDRYALYRRSTDVNDGRVALITGDAAPGAGVKAFTVQGGAGSPITGAAGQLYYVAKRVEHVGGTLVVPSMDDTTVPRMFAKGAAALDEADPRVLAPPRGGGSLELDLELQPLQTLGSGTTLPRGPAMAGDLLDSIFDVEADGTAALAANGAQVGSAGSTPDHSTALVAAASGERFDAGNIVLVQGEAAQVRAIVDGGAGNDTLRLFPQLSQAALTDASATALSGGWNLRPIVSGFRSHSYMFFMGGRRWEVSGWLPNLQITGVVRDGHGTLKFSGPFAAHWHDGYTMPTLISSQGGNRWPLPLDESGNVQVEVPILGGRSRVIVRDTRRVGNAWDNVSDEVIEVTLDMGYKFGPRPSVGAFARNAGTGYAGRRTTVGTLRIWAEDLTWRDRVEAGAEFELFVQLGTVRGGIFVMALPRVQFINATPSVADGAYQWELPFEVVRTGLDATDNTSGATVTTRLPDVTLAYL